MAELGAWLSSIGLSDKKLKSALEVCEKNEIEEV
eukprot:SAG11_NODE_32354_length_284_cov_0.843243_1_plen_33_part_10